MTFAIAVWVVTVWVVCKSLSENRPGYRPSSKTPAPLQRLATRYDKTADSFLGFVLIACIRLWIRHFVDIT